jgi:hypothetical protein
MEGKPRELIEQKRFRPNGMPVEGVGTVSG